jgi:hypothetical protein
MTAAARTARKSPETRRESLGTLVLEELLPVSADPQDGRWYLAAISYSYGQASSVSSCVARGAFGRGVAICTGLIPSRNKSQKACEGEQYAVFLKRPKKRGSRTAWANSAASQPVL